jgi:hypothetical protein
LLSKAVARPVRVQWSRSDEHGWAPLGPPIIIDLRAGMDNSGDVAAWESEVFFPQNVGIPPLVLLVSATLLKKSFDAMVEAEATFKADLEKLLKNEGHMPEDKFLVMSRKGKRLGVAFASTPRGEGGAGSLKFKTK